ncbi:MAG: SDR family NAD(P)-dependent oxidoreductase [Planctomycetes bacterium]|nr:SDR family NAD(P)-dependent oxidoreductase [Planctomycetota bacterium]
MARLLEDRVAIVTGASQGLGAAIAAALAVDGGRVLLVARREKELGEVAESVRRAGGIAAIAPQDITAPDAAPRIVDACLGEYGGLDILINCAGAFVWQKFFDLSPDDWNRTVATNLTAPFFLMQEAARVMATQSRGGAIVNIASIHAEIGDPNVVPQCASKSALLGLTASAAEALREYNIRVNAISPGAIEPSSAARRGESTLEKVTQADIATLVVYLCSDLARTTTGSVIDMYGSTRRIIKA